MRRSACSSSDRWCRGSSRQCLPPAGALATWHTTGRLVNFLSTVDAGPAHVAAAYPPEVAARLQDLKDRFDPHGLFRHGHALLTTRKEHVR